MKRSLAILLALLCVMATVPALGETTTPADTVSTTVTAAPEELLQQWYQIGAQLRVNGLYPYVELKKGDTGYEVLALQTRLAELGYYEKAVVTKFGGGTYSAMRAFEKANGLPVNGVASVADQQLLFSANAVAYTAQTKTGSNAGSSRSSSQPDTDATSGATN
ncbi:MAG: hypothetical protein GX418_10005 [Clostridiales bacterium]|nr:hypothetical protein [Clostridiales bacterium]